MSKPEEEFLFQLRACKVPDFWREFRFHRTRKWRLDFAFPDHLVAVEIQGGVFSGGRHSRGAGITKDCEKLSHAAALGWRVLPVTPAQVKSGEALKWTLAALEAR